MPKNSLLTMPVLFIAMNESPINATRVIMLYSVNFFFQVYGKAQISLEILNPSAAIYFLKYVLKTMKGAPVWRPELALYMSRTLQMRKGHSLNFL